MHRESSLLLLALVMEEEEEGPGQLPSLEEAGSRFCRGGLQPCHLIGLSPVRPERGWLSCIKLVLFKALILGLRWSCHGKLMRFTAFSSLSSILQTHLDFRT